MDWRGELEGRGDMPGRMVRETACAWAYPLHIFPSKITSLWTVIGRIQRGREGGARTMAV